MARTRDVIRVAYYTDASLRGGAEHSLGNLLAHLSDRIETAIVGVDPHVVEWLADRRPDAITRVLPPVRDKRDARAIASHVRTIRELRPDILHVNMPWTFACRYGILAGVLTPGVRTVAVDQSPIDTPSALQHASGRLILKRLDVLVTVGERSCRTLERILALPPGTARVIYNGVPELPRRSAPPRSPGHVVGSVGRLVPGKRFDVLIGAVAKLDGARLVLVGDGPERPALEKLADEIGMSDRLEITGWSDDVQRCLHTFDVFALSSSREGFPLVIPEALLAGLPVVATDVGSVAEAVVDHETGFLVRPGDSDAMAQAISRVFEDPEGSRRMGERGRSYAQQRFTATVMAKAFESLYDEVCHP